MPYAYVYGFPLGYPGPRSYEPMPYAYAYAYRLYGFPLDFPGPRSYELG